MINRKPQTLATWDPKLYENLWRCAGNRARNSQTELAGREYDSSHAMYAMYEKRKKPAFSPEFPDPIQRNTTRFDCLLIDRNKHVENALNGKPMQLPDYLSDAISDEYKGWQEMLGDWLTVNDDRKTEYVWHNLTIGAAESDLSGEISLTYFTDGTGDQHWRPFFAVVDGEIYDCTDTTLGDCDLLEDTIGWYIYTLDGESLPDECRTDQLSRGYCSNPTSELEKQLYRDSEPVWHWGLSCFVGRIKSYAYPVRLYPEAPYYA
jgi:hypothetical protein